MTQKPDLRERVRVRVDLPATVGDALVRLAIREDRAMDRQAARLIAEGLSRAGLLPDIEPAQ